MVANAFYLSASPCRLSCFFLSPQIVLLTFLCLFCSPFLRTGSVTQVEMGYFFKDQFCSRFQPDRLSLDLLHFKDSHPVVLAFVRFRFRCFVLLRTPRALRPKGKTGVLLFRVSATPFGTRNTERRFGKGVKIFAERRRKRQSQGGYLRYPRMKRKKTSIDSVKHSSLLFYFSFLAHITSPLFRPCFWRSWFLTPIS